MKDPIKRSNTQYLLGNIVPKEYSQYNNIPGYLKTLSPKRGQQVVFPINEKGTV